MSRTFHNLPHLPAGSSPLSFPCWRRELPLANSWTLLLSLSDIRSTAHLAEAPAHPSTLLGKMSIAAGRGWVHRWEGGGGKSWLEGLGEHWIREPFCHENKDCNCSWFLANQVNLKAIITTKEDFLDQKTGCQDAVCECTMDCKLPFAWDQRWKPYLSPCQKRSAWAGS